MFEEITLAQLFGLPSQQTLVLTANNRLSVFMKSQYLDYDREQRKVVNLPEIMPYKAWLSQLTGQMSFVQPTMPLVLNDMAQEWYWQQTLQKVLSKEQRRHFNIKASSTMLNQARQLQAEWNIHVQADEYNPEYEAFESWSAVYQKMLHHLSAWDTVDLHKALMNTLEQGGLRLPAQVILVGFYSFSAYQQQLFNILKEQGTRVYVLKVERPRAQRVGVYKAEEAYQEVQGALKWLLHQVSTTKARRVALVVPDLQQEAPRLQRIMRRVLRDTALENRWHIAVGRVLSEWELIRSVLVWFALIVDFQQKTTVPAAQIGEALLNARFAFSLEQRERLALWDSQLRQYGNSSVSFKTFYDTLHQIAPEQAEVFAQTLQRWEKPCRCADWMQRYRDALTAFRFPAEQLSSVQYQLCQSFEQALKKFAFLDEMLPALDAESVFPLWRQFLTQQNFQAQRHADVLLDVVGLYELEGGKWDAVWVLGLTDDVLPQRPSPNPYLPIRSQRRAQVTHASPESEMQLAQQLFNAILRSAKEVRLSYPQMNNDTILRPSSLLKPYLDEAKILSLQAFQPTRQLTLEYLDDRQGLPKQGAMPGGYGLLERQSRNPLWAYAVARLGLKALPDYAQNDLNAAVHGNFLHKVMELFYAQLPSHTALQDEELVEQTLYNVLLTASQSELKNIHSPALQSLVVERTKELAKRFIRFDQEKRQAFNVQQRESTYDFASHGIFIKLKIDRLDQLEDGSWVFVDYKSGKILTLKQCKEHWIERERLVDVQLPLYASTLGIVSPEKVTGISFASLARGKVFYEGLWQSKQYEGQSDDSIFSLEEWLSLNQQWRQKLETLCVELAQGEASNRYFHEDDVKYCEVRPFLRLHATSEGESDE